MDRLLTAAYRSRLVKWYSLQAHPALAIYFLADNVEAAVVKDEQGRPFIVVRE